MKQYYYLYIDDVIWALRDLAREKPNSLFENSFFGMLKNAHERYGLKTQLHLFYRTDFYYGMDEFTLSEVPDTYKREFEESSDWLKFNFHSLQEFPDYPLVNASYEDVYKLYNMVKQEIIRFAGEKSLAKSTVIHWGALSYDGCRALADSGIKLLSASMGTSFEYDGDPTSLPYGHAGRILQNRKPEARVFKRNTRDTAILNSVCGYNFIEEKSFPQAGDNSLGYVTDEKTGLKMKKFCNSLVLNLFSDDDLKDALESRISDELIGTLTHEQYFYKDYYAYQPEYEQKIYTLGKTMKEAGIIPIFPEDILELE